MGRTTKLTPETQATIVSYIRAGAYDWVAAQAAGIDPLTFRRWMARGQRPGPENEPYRTFRTEVQHARAQARLAAEVEVRKTDAFKWLRYGPGRERPGEPGWTESTELTGPEAGPLRVRIVEHIVERAEDADEDSDDVAETSGEEEEQG